MPRIIKPVKGSFTTADVTIDSSGRVIAATSGSAGSPDFVKTFSDFAPGTSDVTSTFTAQPGTTKLQVYMCGGGGGGGSRGNNETAGRGGPGGYGFFSIPVSSPAPSPFSAPYTLAGGQTGSPTAGTAPGSANDSTFGNPVLATCTGGGGGRGGNQGFPTPANPNPNCQGNTGSAPGATIDYTITAGRQTVPNSFVPAHAQVNKCIGQQTAFMQFVGTPEYYTVATIPGGTSVADLTELSPANADPFAGCGGFTCRGSHRPTGRPGNGGGIVIFENIDS